MAPSRDDTMTIFDINEHSIAIVNLDHPHGVTIKSNIWVKNVLNNTFNSSVHAALIFTTGAVDIQTSVSTQKAQELIELLHLHIETIKAAEIEIIAQSVGVAA